MVAPIVLGLTAEEARRRLREDGPNELRVARGGSVLHALRALLAEPLFVLLFATAAIYAWLGERTEALALVASAGVAAGITVYQRWRTERVLIALRDLSAPRALVLRDGQPLRIAAREVVRDDCIVLREGDRIAADARVVEAENLLVDESLLTGESAPVHKFAADGGDGDAAQRLYANTLVVAGQARAVVTATGAATQFGRIGSALGTLEEAQTPLQRDTAQLARGFGLAGAAVSLAIVVAYGVLEGAWIDGLLRGLTLAMAILPEEFPLVITVFLALGAWRLAGQQVLTRRAGAIEALGAATVLCVDKTGTLTVNRMQMARAMAAGHAMHEVAPGEPPRAGLHALARAAALASEPQPFDPMEVACHDWARDQGVAAPPAAQLQRRWPLSAERLIVGHAWRDGARRWRVAAKGAPEHVLALCRALTADERARVLDAVRTMAEDGMRVLGVAAADVDADALPAELAALPLRYLGLIGFADPLRAEVPQAVADCHRAGIRILMITGDYPATAAAIARAAGIAAEPGVVAGDELAQWDDATLAARLRGIDVVARATPLTKLRLVQALQLAGEVVAMTGDGVNDAPALRAAHIGVAMGQRGSDVAREAAALVLLRDDFHSLVAAVRQGRRIFANLRQAMLYVLAVHVPMIGIAVLPLALGAPPMLLPLHVMFLEFVIDPACSLAFEAEVEGSDPMCDPPRPPREHVLDRRHLAAALVQGAIAFAAAAATLVVGLRAGAPEGALRAATMTAIVAMNVALILHNRSAAHRWIARGGRTNRVLWLIVGTTVAAWAAVLAVPALRALFRIDAPTLAMAAWLLPCIAVAVAALRLAGRRPLGAAPAAPG